MCVFLLRALLSLLASAGGRAMSRSPTLYRPLGSRASSNARPTCGMILSTLETLASAKNLLPPPSPGLSTSLKLPPDSARTSEAEVA